MPPWRVVLAAAAVVGYIALAYVLMARYAEAPATIALLFGPFVAALGLSAWRRRHLPSMALVAALAAVLVALCASPALLDVERLYLLQHGLIHAALAYAFATTLRPGSTPLITRIAAMLHTDFTPAMRAYTRRLTGVWVAYFVAMIAVSLGVYALLPWSAWALFCNVLTPLAAALLFGAEHLLRYWRHPEFERASVAAALRAYRVATLGDEAHR